MGEIGIQRDMALRKLRWWEIMCIIRGYNRRHWHTWSAARWSTFNIMSAQVGSKGMQEAHIYKPEDLLELPWEQQAHREKITQEDINDIHAIMDAINHKNEI